MIRCLLFNPTKVSSPIFERSVSNKKKVTSLSAACNFFAREKHTVSLQLDYYMSAQFAGIASAMGHGLYEQKGIDLEFLPICPVGEEMHRVRERADSNDKDAVHLGSIEQNIFIPTLARNPDLKVKAVAAMFRKSPLCLASLSAKDKNKLTGLVGAHEDTVSLLERILHNDPSMTPVASPRATKNTDLMAGKYDYIQAYCTTEVPTLERKLGKGSVEMMTLEGLNGARLGYSQLLFATEESLLEHHKRDIVRDFLDATFMGWHKAIRDHKEAARHVREAQALLDHLEDEHNDHWESSVDYIIQNVGLCCNHVKETFQGDRYGVINPSRFHDATTWLLEEQKHISSSLTGAEASFGLDEKIWQPSPKLLSGNELARNMLHSVRQSAVDFETKFGRKPSLAVITVGDQPRYVDGERRLEVYSNNENSWFDKTKVGQSNNIDVKEINLPESTTEDELLSHLYNLQEKDNVDGIQLMWPMPSHIDTAKIYNSISINRDVDGAHYVGQLELGKPSSATDVLPPVTPMAVMKLIDHYGISLENKNVCITGRSRIVGSPLAYMLRERNAIVTVAHSKVPAEKLKGLIQSCDIVFACAGAPGTLKTKWFENTPGDDKIVVHIGTTFDKEKDILLSDMDDYSNLNSSGVHYSPVPGGVGPLSVAQLFENVVTAAWNRESSLSALVEKTWSRKSDRLTRSIHFDNYDDALTFVNKVNTISSELDHHANMSLSHKCVKGVDLTLDFFSFEANKVTDKDYEAALKITDLLAENVNNESIKMSDYTYNLKEESIAKYPAEPRGSSRLLRVTSDGSVSYFDNFSNSFMSLLNSEKDSSHIIFNESKVAKARLSVIPDDSNSSTGLEMMILDLGDENIFTPGNKSHGLKLHVMLRKQNVQVGDTFTEENSGKSKFCVVDVKGPWIEDEKSNGNGTECVVQCMVDDHDKEISLESLLEKVGTVPIPPYLDRHAELGDEAAYNNVYASGIGSVAAPTAGLHFTDELLNKITSDGKNKISFLSLHVGAGTFRPVVTEDARDHDMHGESYSVSVTEVHRIIDSLENNKSIVVVGTTSCRTLESLYWSGVKKVLSDNHAKYRYSVDDNNAIMMLGQDEWAQLGKRDGANFISAADALRAIVEMKGDDNVIKGRTSLMIVPEKYDFKVVDELVTNFHAPDSTLMLLVSAFLGSGEKVRTVYEEAQERSYRFLSYGDVCFFSKPKRKD